MSARAAEESAPRWTSPSVVGGSTAGSRARGQRCAAQLCSPSTGPKQLNAPTSSASGMCDSLADQTSHGLP